MATASPQRGWLWIAGLAALLLVVSAFAWRAARPQAAAEQARDAIAAALADSAAAGLPAQVDPDSRVESVAVEPDGAVTFQVRLTSLAPEDFQAGWLEGMATTMRERVCRSADARPLLAAGGSVVYELRLTDQALAGRISVTAADCDLGAAA